MMNELHSQGKAIEDIKEVLRRAPIHPNVVPAMKKAHSLGYDLRIVSDANILFIEIILDYLGIKDCFSEINTNPTYVNEEGRLRISPYIDFHSYPHGCNLCPPNMCKGVIIERIQSSFSIERNKRMIYLGDGIGDFCPSLKLKEEEFFMPRKNFPVWNLICESRMLLRAEIQEWANGEELEHVMIKLINIIEIQDSSIPSTTELLSIDCKFERAPMVAHEALIPTLVVHQ